MAESLDPYLLQRSPSFKTIRKQFSKRSKSVLQGSQSMSNDPSIESEHLINLSDPIPASVEEIGSKNASFSTSCIECVKPFQVITRDDLTEGDHIIHVGKVYEHHAIIIKVEPDETDETNMKKAKVTLIHATNSPLGLSVGLTKLFGSKAKIRLTVEYFDFDCNNIMIAKYFNAPFDTREIIRRAEEEHQKQDFRYDLVGNNCEHFATYCVTNERFSIQVRKLKMTFKMFLSRRFIDLGDEKLRNQVAYERKLLCKLCFERNTKLFAAEKKHIKKKSDVNEGDIITFSYWHLHHDAIVLQVHEDEAGNGNGVDLTYVHYAFCGPFKHRTIKEERKIFPLDGSISVNMYKSPQYNVYSPGEYVERAKSRIGEQQFSFFANDSSHFARWCKLKLSHSS